MKKQSRLDIPTAKLVVAFQPREFGMSRHGMEPGRVALFRWGDPRVHLFDCFDGACWEGWRLNPDRQLAWLLELRDGLVGECGFAWTHVDEAFLACSEYADYREKACLGEWRGTSSR